MSLSALVTEYVLLLIGFATVHFCLLHYHLGKVHCSCRDNQNKQEESQ